MKKLSQKLKNLSRAEKIVLGIVITLTLFRIFLALKLPLHIQADAVYDDRLFVDYAKNLLGFSWLGAFDQLTLAKGCSSAVFLALNYLIGVPYTFSLIAIYIGGLILLCLALKKVIRNNYFLAILYTFLLYIPVMFHDENVQKVYRGGLLIGVTIIIVAAFIGIYTRISEKYKALPWAIIASIALSFFWFLKEDSIWILPFVAVLLIATILRIIFSRKTAKKFKVRKLLIAIMPICLLAVSIFGYKTVNYFSYGEFTITDRNGTAFKDVMGDLLHIDSSDRSAKNWITRSMLEKAYAVSPTLSELKDEMDAKYPSWAGSDGEINGDIIFWVIKDATYEHGIYGAEDQGKTVDKFYSSIHTELTEAFARGDLAKNNDLYISSAAKGINASELPDFLALLNRAKDIGITYAYNETGVYPATGDRTGIALFSELTMSQYVDPEADSAIYKPARIVARISNYITKIYQKIGQPLFYLSIIALVAFTIFVLVQFIRKTLSANLLTIFLALFGLAGSSFAQFFGTTFFCRFLSEKKVYDYISPMLPLLAIIEIVSLYLVFLAIRHLARKKRR